MSVAIVGAGIAGLTAAIALRREGIDVSVYERANEIRRGGGGLILMSNATRVLRRIGIGDAVERLAGPLDEVELRTWRGELLTTLAPGEWGRRFGAPCVVIARSDLMTCLAEALPAGVVRTGRACTGFTTDGDAVEVHFEDGSSERHEVLVGADGIHSVVREQLLGPAPLRRAGQVAWVGIARWPEPVLPVGLAIGVVGAGPRFGAIELPSGRAYWYAVLRESGVSAIPVAGKEDLLRIFRDWLPPIPGLIEATDDGEMVAARLCDRPVPPRWGAGRVTLLGDAVHPSLPDMGQGACQAIEGAAVLAQAVRGHRDLAAGLREYELRRTRRAAEVTQRAWMMALTSAPEDPVSIGIRDLATRLGLRLVIESQIEWLLGHPASPISP